MLNALALSIVSADESVLPFESFAVIVTVPGQAFAATVAVIGEPVQTPVPVAAL